MGVFKQERVQRNQEHHRIKHHRLKSIAKNEKQRDNCPQEADQRRALEKDKARAEE
jgi:hypothetical protein